MTEKSKVSILALVVLSVVGLVFFVSGSANAAPPASTISYWKLDETTPDVPTDPGVYVDSVGSNDGASTGVSPTLSPAPSDPLDSDAAQVGGALVFDDTDTGIEVPADDTFNWLATDSFSIECWVKGPIANPPGSQVFVGREDDVGPFNWWVGIRATGFAAFKLVANNGDGDPTLEGATISLADGGWHHIVAVRDASTGQNLIYVDGQFEVSAIRSYDVATGFDSQTIPMNIGYFPSGYHFEGTLDEIALYDKALTAAEVDEHYQAGLAGEGIDTLEPDPTPPTPPTPTSSGGGSSGCFIGTMAE